LNLFNRNIRQDGGDAIARVVKKDGICDCQSDGPAAKLCAGDKADCYWNLFVADFSLSDGERGLKEGARADARKDCVAVDRRVRG
jgi:hypothetical protein